MSSKWELIKLHRKPLVVGLITFILLSTAVSFYTAILPVFISVFTSVELWSFWLYRIIAISLLIVVLYLTQRILVTKKQVLIASVTAGGLIAITFAIVYLSYAAPLFLKLDYCAKNYAPVPDECLPYMERPLLFWRLFIAPFFSYLVLFTILNAIINLGLSRLLHSKVHKTS